jgi:hypothetical protein
MKVKIVKGAGWYSDKVGEMFDFVSEASIVYIVNHGGDTENYGIFKSDCELISDPVKIPFTFAAWDKDRTQKVWTRDGREVKQLTWFDVNVSFPLMGVLDNEIEAFTKNGSYYENENENEENEDLFLEHHEKEYFVNIYQSKEGIKFGTAYDSEQGAKDAFVITEDIYIKTISFKA